MTPVIEEARRYLQLADDDAAAFRGLLKLPEVKFRLACFHAQQAVENSNGQGCIDLSLTNRGVKSCFVAWQPA